MMTNNDTLFDIFKLSILLLIFTLNLKSGFSKVFALIPNPSEPKSKIFSHGLCLVKSFFALISKALIQNSFVLKILMQYLYLKL